MKRDSRIVLYPEYFDRNLSRKEGRRTPLKLSVPSPDARALFDAAGALGLDPILENERHYPRTWYMRRGRVLVEKKGSKCSIIRMVAEELKRRTPSG
ncbi:MAG: signal recognition particle protein Srp19 [Thermoplasmata archaeon]|nr:MAG: signal recognition particle protein Srp19 [Thermoplasmata archaeon]RLF69519.1 MAG: signal recognition particle protein Srp19 [Thermoplasmata archaeon]